MHEHTIAELSRLIAPTGPAPSEDTINADLARGRHAAKRRRLKVAAAIGARTPAPHTTAQSGTNTAQQGSRPTVRLVSYTGEQPDGYHLAKIPEGFTMECSDNIALVLGHGNYHPEGCSGWGPLDEGRIMISQSEGFTTTANRREV